MRRGVTPHIGARCAEGHASSRRRQDVSPSGITALAFHAIHSRRTPVPRLAGWQPSRASPHLSVSKTGLFAIDQGFLGLKTQMP